MGNLDHRGIGRWPLGNPDEDSSLHRRRDRDDAHCLRPGDKGEGETFATEIRAAKEPSSKPFRLPSVSLNPPELGEWDVAAGPLARQALLHWRSRVPWKSPVACESPAASSWLASPITTMRRYSAARVSLADVAKICRDSGVTVNDVALAAITDDFRAALVRRGEQPRRFARTLVPVSIRSNDAANATDNRVSLMLPFLPVDKEDPQTNCRRCTAASTRAKSSGQRQAGEIFIAAVDVERSLSRPGPYVLQPTAAAWRCNCGDERAGPTETATIIGREVVRMFPIPPITLQLRTGIAIFSYADELVFGITADYDAAPDVDQLARGIEHAVARLLAVGTSYD